MNKSKHLIRLKIKCNYLYILTGSFMFSRNAFKTYEDYLTRDVNIDYICEYLNDRASSNILKVCLRNSAISIYVDRNFI